MKITPAPEFEPSTKTFEPTNTASAEDISLVVAEQLIEIDSLNGSEHIQKITENLRDSPCFAKLALGLSDPGQTLEALHGDFNLQDLCAYMFLAGQISASAEYRRREEVKVIQAAIGAVPLSLGPKGLKLQKKAS